jgi:hypothetical protein
MAGNAGNAGNVGDAGGVGAVSGGSGSRWFLPDRVDLPFVTVDYPPGHPISSNRIKIRQYPDCNWSAEWRAWCALSEYATTDWRDIRPDPWKEEDTDCEIPQLIVAARDERADALGEILAQHHEFASYFMALLMIGSATHPGTFRIISIASIVATFTVLHFKNGVECDSDYKGYKPRPRPSQVCPALLPPVQVPGHPSYPSGHSTEAHLIARCLRDILGHGEYSYLKNDLEALANRIARNREIAGLHYPSDSRAGKALAESIFERVKCIPAYKLAKKIACTEWEVPYGEGKPNTPET